MPETLTDWFPPEFARYQLSRHPAPKSRATGEPMWEKGIRLHGQQANAVMDPYRFKKIDGGIRFGKSFSGGGMIYLDLLWRWTERGIFDDLYGIIGDSYAMAQEEMNHLHRLLEERGFPHEFFTPENASWRITFPEIPCMVRTLTASDVTKIASRPYRGLILAEAAQQSPDVLEKAIGRVSETRGWVLLEGTFEKQKGRWYAQLTEQWKRPTGMGVVYTCPSWDNPLVYPGGRNDPEILERERTMPRSSFLEMYAGDPQMPSEIVMREANERFNVRRRFPLLRSSFDPEAPVYLFVDPGISHGYAVMACQFYASDEFVQDWERQIIVDSRPGILGQPIERGRRNRPYDGTGGNICHVIDAVFRWNRMTPAIIQEVLSRPWAPNVQEAVMDFAARQRRSEGPPVVEQWAKEWATNMGRPLPIHADPVPLAAGYDTHKVALRNAWPEEEAAANFNWDGKMTYGSLTDPAGPRLYIDPDVAPIFFGGQVDDREYGGEYYLHKNRVSGRDGSITSDEPIDRDNDAIKAMSYGLMWWFGAARMRNKLRFDYSAPFEMLIA